MARLGEPARTPATRRKRPGQLKHRPEFVRSEAQQMDFIGRLFHAERVHRGMTLRDAGKHLKVGYSTLCRVENGDIPSAITLIRVLAFLGFDLMGELEETRSRV